MNNAVRSAFAASLLFVAACASRQPAPPPPAPAPEVTAPKPEVAPAAVEAPAPKALPEKVTLQADALFDFDKSAIRADAVKAYLVSQGMPAEKIHTEGRGEREPIADNKTKEGRQENRRVDVAVAGTTTQPQVVGQTPSESTTTTQ